jgi:hypothetical protein
MTNCRGGIPVDETIQSWFLKLIKDAYIYIHRSFIHPNQIEWRICLEKS